MATALKAVSTNHPSSEDLSALVQHELQDPLMSLQGAMRLLSTGRFGKLSKEGSHLLQSALVNLDRLTRLANAVEAQPESLSSVLSVEQIKLLNLKRDLPKAVEENQLYLVYQPIVCAESNAINGFEALARWHHPNYGAISPTVFIPLAEESGLIHQMSKQLITKACMQLRHWQQNCSHHQPLTVSVNLSVLQLSQLDLVDHIKHVLEITQLEPRSLKLEITESALIENSDVVMIVLKKLRELGVQLYLDDFGTGYSALSRLSSLPLDTLKIDRSFVANQNWEICEIIYSLAEKLKLQVIVEGVETKEEVTVLRRIGFRYLQGYFFSHPLTSEAASSLLSDFSSVSVPKHSHNQWLYEEMPLAS